MRKLMWFTIGFSIACGTGIYLASGSWLLLLGFFSLIAGITLWKRTGAFSRKAVCVLVGCVVGFVWFWCFDHFYLAPVRQLDAQIKFLQVEVTDYPRSSQYGITCDGTTEFDGKTYKVQFYINESINLSPGDRVEGGFRLRYTGGGSEKPTYHRGKGIFLLCYPKGQCQVISQDTVPVRFRAALWRQKILTFLEQLFPADTQAFAKALLLGQTIDLDYDTRTSLKTSGVYHVVAVSGMHVSILFALVFLLCGKRRGFTALIGVPVLIAFAAIAGFSPSIVRACVMQVMMILALLINREYDPPTALAAAVLGILACNPLTITYVGFQLSVGCMAGIFLFTKRIGEYCYHHTKLGPAKGKGLKARLTRFVVGSVSVTLGAMSFTAPLCAWYFGCVSLSGIVTNLLVLWLISLIFYGVMAACILGVIWLPLGIAVGWVLSYPVRAVLWVTDMISRLPVSAVYTASIYIVAWLILCYVLIAVFLKNKKKHPAVLAVCIVVGLVCAIACSWMEPRLDNYRITAVDVGQGQCLILQNNGKYYMVDCGGDDGDTAADRATGLLLSQGIFRLDGLILTHYDADHAGGVEQLLSRIPADTLYLPVLEQENETKDALSSRYGEKIQWITEDLTLEDAGITIYPSSNLQDANDCSLCILFQPEGCDILITGDRSFDGELELLAHTDLPDLEILIAGHHGSRTSTSWELLNETRPELVMISVGADNSYGHPTQETLDRIELFGCKVYRTDLEGTIIFRG